MNRLSPRLRGLNLPPEKRYGERTHPFRILFLSSTLWIVKGSGRTSGLRVVV